MPALDEIQPVLMVRDVEASIRFYLGLGFREVFRDVPSSPKYAAIGRDGIELHLQWHDSKEWEFPNDRPTYRFVVQDVDGLFSEFRERGVLNVNSILSDTPWATREFHIQDPDRNGLQFYRNLR